MESRFLGGAFHGVKGSFYPTVGIDSACPVRINLGAEPFAFDLAAALREGGQEAAAREVRAFTGSVVLHRHYCCRFCSLLRCAVIATSSSCYLELSLSPKIRT